MHVLHGNTNWCDNSPLSLQIYMAAAKQTRCVESDIPGTCELRSGTGGQTSASASACQVCQFNSIAMLGCRKCTCVTPVRGHVHPHRWAPAMGRQTLAPAPPTRRGQSKTVQSTLTNAHDIVHHVRTVNIAGGFMYASILDVVVPAAGPPVLSHVYVVT